MHLPPPQACADPENIVGQRGCFCYKSSIYFTDGRADLLLRQLDLSDPNATEGFNCFSRGSVPVFLMKSIESFQVGSGQTPVPPLDPLHDDQQRRQRNSSVVRHLPLVLEVPGSIPARGEENFSVRTRFLWYHLQE